MRFAFIAKHRHIWPVSWLCEALEVSRSGFRAWINRPTSTREIHDARLVMAIETSFKASDRTYGARRVWRDLLEEGLACGLHRIERLMRCNAFRARPRRRGKPKDDGDRSVIADNILDRDFQQIGQTRSGWPISHTSGLPRAGCMSQSFSTCFPAARSVGP